MAVCGALTLALAVAASAGGERVLLCRPRLAGDAALARGDAVVEAAKRTGRFLDYGVVCEDAAEGARAARRVGLSHAVSGTVEGRVDGSRTVLVLADAATESERARQVVEVAAGGDAAGPLAGALRELLRAIPAAPPARRRHAAAWTTVGAGVASLAAGVAFAARARSSASEANRAGDPAAYTAARDAWRGQRTASGVLLGAGAAAVAAGLTWRFAF